MSSGCQPRAAARSIASRSTVGAWPTCRRIANAGVYVLAYVELDEGPRIMTNIVECDPDSVRIGQKVELVFHDTGEGNALARFRPATA